MGWTKVLDFPRDHRFFKNDDGRVAVADRSGGNPDTTDDGPLWLDTSRAVRLGTHYAVVPVLKGKDPLHVVCSLSQAVTVAKTFGFDRLVAEGEIGRMLTAMGNSDGVEIEP